MGPHFKQTKLKEFLQTESPNRDAKFQVYNFTLQTEKDWHTLTDMDNSDHTDSLHESILKPLL